MAKSSPQHKADSFEELAIFLAATLREEKFVELTSSLQTDDVKLLQFHLGKLVDVSIEEIQPEVENS